MKSIFAPWLISFYRWYCQEANFSGPEYDNFCRFGRIVFLWGPLLWLFKAVFCNKIVGPIRLWMVLLVAGFVTLVVFQPQLALAVTIGAVFIAVFWFLMDSLISERVVYRILSFGWGILRVWTLFLAAGLAAFAYFDWAGFLDIMLMLAVMAAFVVVLVGLVTVVAFLVSLLPKREKRSRSQTRQSPQILRNAAGVASIGWHWLVLIKRRTICPWVQLTPDGYIRFYWSDEKPEEIG